MGTTIVKSQPELVYLSEESEKRRKINKVLIITKMLEIAQVLSGKVSKFKTLHQLMSESAKTQSIKMNESIFNRALSESGITYNQLQFYNSGDFTNVEWAFEAGV